MFSNICRPYVLYNCWLGLKVINSLYKRKREPPEMLARTLRAKAPWSDL